MNRQNYSNSLYKNTKTKWLLNVLNHLQSTSTGIIIIKCTVEVEVD